MNQARRPLAIAVSTPAPALPASIRPEEAQSSHQSLLPLAASHPEPSPAFEPVLNTEKAAALLQVHPKTLQKMAREGSVPAFRIGDLWRFRASALDAKGRFSLFTRTRYQYGSLETKERKKGKEVWEFRYYETDGQGERQRRAVTVGTLQEYPTETAARKSSVVQAILLRLNAEQPAAADTAEFGA